VLVGSPRRLGNLVGQDGTWTPSGDLMIAKDSELLLAKSDGSGLNKFLSVAGSPLGVRWSPDGRAMK